MIQLEEQGGFIQWYPGHIAKAERLLKEQISMVDVVLEVRDARYAHPSGLLGTLARLLSDKMRLRVCD